MHNQLDSLVFGVDVQDNLAVWSRGLTQLVGVDVKGRGLAMLPLWDTRDATMLRDLVQNAHTEQGTTNIILPLRSDNGHTITLKLQIVRRFGGGAVLVGGDVCIYDSSCHRTRDSVGGDRLEVRRAFTIHTAIADADHV